ncbi:hypothetical protein LCGC14_2342860 [marine sediment metagenome]|uniref:Uncharacterized protein n=1 Tax=marine sediment metagenome TaxID=412755 RepID=A0A0F9F6K5_9ZZZZ
MSKVEIIDLPCCPVCGCNSCDCGAKEYYDEVIRLQAKIEKLEELLEKILKREACTWCGGFFRYPKHIKCKKNECPTHGYPVVCKPCGHDYTDKQLKELGLERAHYPLL